MRFNLRMLLYGMAVLAAGLAAFGAWGWLLAAGVLAFWWLDFRVRGRERNAFAGCLALSLFVGLVLLLPDVGSRPVSPANRCRNNLRQITIALYEYHDTYGTFPPAYVADEEGKPLHSWRVLILPYMEEQTLYDSYDFSEPWDGPNNRRLASVNMDLFQCPAASLAAGETTVFAVVGPEAAWLAGGGRTVSEFADGADETILLIEAVGRGVNWMEPKDLTFDEALALLTAAEAKDSSPLHARKHLFHYSHFSRHVATAGGSVHPLPTGVPHDVAERLLTVGGGRRLDSWPPSVDPTDMRLHWPRIWGLAVFVWLALLPLPWAARVGLGKSSQPAG